ncbi:PKD domain-containing protein [Chryseobacterium soli]|uniref:PKD domain-containing protein n=1 Tax=Chryseobacterium soli TaxID=445961 RepID=UPI00295431BC|nr:PKD domain-containing protein [Chryseobacterium soli]MDV7698162.1 PKD domain-containing protein [Chryseobacterium soli]
MKKNILLFLLFCAMLVSAQSPLSKFTATATGANTVSFSSTSDGNPTSFSWEFAGGNPATSTSSTPSISYAAAGTYTAKLTVSNASGSSVSTRTVKVTTGNIIDLCTGRNNDGSLMADPDPDPDWSYADINGVVSTPVIRYTFTGWSSASTGDVAGISRWITGNNAITGYHEYKSKEIEIPTGITTAVLNLRSLSFVRNWTYLVKKNTDGTETETQITLTTYMSDGAKGWLNSRSPEVINYPLSPGKYYIKVKLYTNNGSQRQAIDVNANVNFGYGFTFSPLAEFSAAPTSTTVGSNVQFTNLSQGTPSSVLWNFEDGTNVLTSSLNNPAIAFSTVGSHHAELNADYGNSLVSSLKINNYIQTIQMNAPTAVATQPSCSIPSGSITVTSPNTGVTYSFDNGNSFQSLNTISGLASGTYLVKVKSIQGDVSDATSVTINQAPAVPNAPVFTIVQPACPVNTGNITITSPASGVEYSFDGGVTYQTSNVKTGLAAGTYSIMVKSANGCTASASAVINSVDCRDWTLAPNSYIFTGKDQNNNEVDGIYIPVKKAYTMWNSTTNLIAGNPIPSGTVTADVLWEDVHGLIKTGENYALDIIGTGTDARIKVPVNKAKKGNAVVTYKINGETYWSWHIWVTDDPTNGSTYKSYTAVQRQLKNGTLEDIPNSDWGWMDRNLGAIGNSMTGTNWNKNGGLLYQWGRKDPFPALVAKGDDFYEVTGSIGKRVRHFDAHETNQWVGTSLDELERRVKLQDASVKNNIQLSIRNPLSLIYIQNNNDSNQAFYNNNLNLPYNWFGTSSSLTAERLGELNLWSDNSQGQITPSNYNFNSQKRPYKNKSSYDPCPNGWRIPSMLVANLGNYSYVDDVRIDYSPFGINPNAGTTYNTMPKTILPSNTNMPAYMQNFRIYPQTGFDMRNISGNNLGIFPGTGNLYAYNSEYTDGHETYLWTATMSRWYDVTPSTVARSLRLLPDAGQYINNYRPDAANFPNVWGRYEYYPLWKNQTSEGLACRCIKDPLFVKNEYDFPITPSDYFIEDAPKYSEGLYNPNTYQIVMSSGVQEQQIPVSKAFSAQSQLLGNPDILKTESFNNLKANVLWTTNTNLIQSVAMSGNVASLADISGTNLIVKIKPNESGNAVVTLHNGSITNPVYWSWHIWVTKSPIATIDPYATEQPIAAAVNYVNYVKKGTVLQTEFMDRNLGAEEAFPTVVTPSSPDTEELKKIKLSGGMQYQWGRKDPIPPFVNPDGTAYEIYLGNVNADGTISYSVLNSGIYNNASGNYIIPYNTYTNTSNANVAATDKISTKVSKVLSYSVKNPLVFMVPSNFAPIFNNNKNYTNGSDWLSNETNIGADRWGRGDKKSPFDPCPAGWRIPDVASVSSSAQFSNFPWAKKDVNEMEAQNISVYGGVRVGNGLGYQFNDSSYKIGNYPFIGIRGYRDILKNANEGGTPDYTKLQSALAGIWTASLNSNYYGRANNMLISKADNVLIPHNDWADPYFGMNCRCVKVRYEGNEEQGAIQALPVTQNTGKQAVNTFMKKEIEQKVITDKLVLYPIPVKDILYIDARDDKEYYYQIYNMSGQLVKTGKFENKQTNVSSLISGAYLIRINDSEAVVKMIKE